mmetsp:Transcript_29035/g.42836  ORF Transcript_29035/g.42836 Transcript_29035/m.42836 type:complete len:86 (-) Transcript_29035:117-374(-)
MTTQSNYLANFQGKALSMICGVSLAVGRTLLFHDHNHNHSDKKDGDDDKLITSIQKAAIRGALFNLGLYLVVPACIRKLWMDEKF